MAQRVALLIGNANYASNPLQNPHNDINVLGHSLEKTGFQVWKLRDASAQQMQNALRQLAARARGADAVLFYFSGHGAQHEGQSYLIPTSPSVRSDHDLKYGALPLNKVLDSLRSTQNRKRVNLVVVDACRTKIQRSSRNAPFGLAAPSTVSAGTLVAFSTAPNTVAYDGRGYTSPYVAELSKAMLLPNLGVETVFKKARIGVMRRTANQQVPWENSSLTVDFSFANRNASTSTSAQPKMCVEGKYMSRADVTVCNNKSLWALENERVRLTEKALRRARGNKDKVFEIKVENLHLDTLRTQCQANVQCTISKYNAYIEQLRRSLGR